AGAPRRPAGRSARGRGSPGRAFLPRLRSRARFERTAGKRSELTMTTPTSRARFVPPSRATQLAAVASIVITLSIGAFLLWQFPRLPDILPVHFKMNGYPDGWQYKTYARVMMPTLVQLALGLTFGAIAFLLLSRPHGEQDQQAPDVKAASTAAEAVALIALV